MEFKPTDEGYDARVRESFARQPFMNLIHAKLEKISPGFA